MGGREPIGFGVFPAFTPSELGGTTRRITVGFCSDMLSPYAGYYFDGFGGGGGGVDGLAEIGFCPMPLCSIGRLVEPRF